MIVLTEIVTQAENSTCETSVILWPTFPQNLQLDVKQQHFPRKELFRCLKITLSRNSCSLDLVHPPFLRTTSIKSILTPLKGEIKLDLSVDKTLKTHSQAFLASGKLINLNLAELWSAIYTLAVYRAKFLFELKVHHIYQVTYGT